MPHTRTLLRVSIFLVLLCASVLASKACGACAEVRNGNIYYRGADGKLRRITEGGRNHSPAVSPDGAQVVFVRDAVDYSEYNDFTRSGPATRVMQLWVANLATGETHLALDSPVEVGGRKYSGFYAPQFSGNGHQIYFMVQSSASSGSVLRVATLGGQPSYFAEALDFAVIPAGQYKDDLIIQQHRSKLAMGYYDWFYLFRPDSSEVGVIG